MTVNPELQALVDKYRYLWEYTGWDVTDVAEPYDADGDTLLHHVAGYSGVDEVNLLVAAGADVNVRGDMGYTPLRCAATWGRPQVAERLLTLGADQSLRNEFGLTALEAAQQGGREEVARLLQRADKNRRLGR